MTDVKHVKQLENISVGHDGARDKFAKHVLHEYSDEVIETSHYFLS